MKFPLNLSQTDLGVCFTGLVSRIENGKAIFVCVNWGDGLLHDDLGDDGDDPGGAGARGGEGHPVPDTVIMLHTGETLA